MKAAQNNKKVVPTKKVKPNAKGKSIGAVVKSKAFAMESKKEKDHFEGVVGQRRAKRELGFYLSNHLESASVLPHFLFAGSKGDGKTHLAKKFGKNLPDLQNPEKKNKAFYTLNGGAILNPTILLEDVLNPRQDQYCTIFIDEAHALPKKVQTVLLSILEPNRQNRTNYTFNDIDYVFDFRKITFIFATTEEDQINHALKDRLRHITLEPYNERELAEIIEMCLEGQVSFEGDLLNELSKYVRRNARAANFVAENVKSFGVPIFKKAQFDILKEKLSMFPRGVSYNEVRILQILRADGECALGHLASRMAQTVKSIQKEGEPYLIAMGLMEISGHRRITGAGQAYLKALEDDWLIVAEKRDENKAEAF